MMGLAVDEKKKLERWSRLLISMGIDIFYASSLQEPRFGLVGYLEKRSIELRGWNELYSMYG